MERLYGATSHALDSAALLQTAVAYRNILIDIGTGDGRYVQHFAQQQPAWLTIGIDACRDQLRNTSRRAPTNAWYIIANALDMPTELHGLANQITMNFPWGSLLRGLFEERTGLAAQLRQIARAKATLDIRLNSSALSEIGLDYSSAAVRCSRVLQAQGFYVHAPIMLDTPTLRTCPTTWAKRFAFGRAPHALQLHAQAH